MAKFNKKILQPQEIEVFYIIPAIRKQLAIEMKSKGIKQKDIADLLGIEDAAVSQYLNNKRGHKIKLTDPIKKKIEGSATKIKDLPSLFRETQSILRFIRNSEEICRIHKQLSAVPIECGGKKCFQE